MGKDKFKAVRLKITDAPIDISQLIISYEDETIQEIQLNGQLAEGAESNVFTLDSPDKEIKKVSFTYRSKPNYEGDRAHVELYGLK